MLIGMSPELEMALYTLCFRTRENGKLCYVSLDNTQFSIKTAKDSGRLKSASFRLFKQ